jgi:hypothetical protein
LGWTGLTNSTGSTDTISKETVFTSWAFR